VFMMCVCCCLCISFISTVTIIKTRKFVYARDAVVEPKASALGHIQSLSTSFSGLGSAELVCQMLSVALAHVGVAFAPRLLSSCVRPSGGGVLNVWQCNQINASGRRFRVFVLCLPAACLLGSRVFITHVGLGRRVAPHIDRIE
jgi:hypothetical protein